MNTKMILTVGLASIVFASCMAPPDPDGDTLNSYNMDRQPPAATLPPDPVKQPPGTTQQANQNTQPLSTPALPMKGSMKTLSDFEAIKASQATIKTTKGDITIQLYQDKAPLTVANFLNLAKSGFYDGIIFHRVIADFMAQVGDPFTKDPSKQAMWGQGGPGYTIADEFGAGLTHDSEGILSMANSGPNTGGSQIFITYAATPWLDGKHAIFGKVTQGMDVLRQITVGDKIISVTYQ